LRLKRLGDVLVELLVRTGGLGGVEVTAAGYVAVGGVEVKGRLDDVEGRERKELCD